MRPLCLKRKALGNLADSLNLFLYWGSQIWPQKGLDWPKWDNSGTLSDQISAIDLIVLWFRSTNPFQLALYAVLSSSQNVLKYDLKKYRNCPIGANLAYFGP